MTDATKAEPIGYVYSHGSVKVGAINQHDIPNGTPLYTHPPESALQRLTEAGEIQAALERIAELEAALRVAERATWSASEHAALYFGVTHNIAMGCHDANLVARAALAGEAKARPAQDDGGYDLLAAWDASKFSAGFFVVHPMYQAGWDAAKAAPKLTEAEILDIRAQSYIGNYGPRPYLDELAFARAIEAKVRGTT